MSSPLIATWRITVPYTVSGLIHKIRHYVRIGTTTPTFNLRYRDASDAVNWHVNANRLADLMGNALPVGSSIGAMLLEQLVGPVWVPQDAFTPTAPTFSGTLAPAQELTVVLRDTAFRKVRVNLLDINLPSLLHTSGLTATVADNYIDKFKITTAGANDPWQWVVSRSNLYLLDSPFAGTTVSPNRKIRRARGLS